MRAFSKGSIAARLESGQSFETFLSGRILEMRTSNFFRVALLWVASIAFSAVSAAEADYKSVGDILKATPFKIVTLAQYKTGIRTGKVVGFFYEDGDVAGASGWMAKNFRDSIDRGTAIVFLAVRYDKAFPDSEYLGLELDTRPQYRMYNNDNNVFTHKGGMDNPSPGDHAKNTEILRNNLKVLSGIR